MTHNYFYKDQICPHCGKQGHIQRVCRSKQQRKPKQATKTPEVHAVEVDVDVDACEDILATFEVHNVRKQCNDIIWVDLDVDGKPLRNWTQVRLCRSSRLTSTSRNLTGFPCTKLDCP